jgi:uncharacterized protein (DUF2237 family)
LARRDSKSILRRGLLTDPDVAELSSIKLGVQPVGGDERGVGATLDNSTVLQHQSLFDIVGKTRDELPGLYLVVIAKSKALDLGEHRVADVVSNAFVNVTRAAATKRSITYNYGAYEKHTRSNPPWVQIAITAAWSSNGAHKRDTFRRRDERRRLGILGRSHSVSPI